MRIVWLNAWGGAMFDELADWLPTCGADVLCLQEVTRTPGMRGWLTFADGERTLPQRADLFADVAALLPDHQAMFLTSDSGPVTDDDGAQHRQQFGIATFVAAGVPVIGQVARFVHGDHTDHARWPATGRPRIAHALRLVDPATGRPLVVAHLHGLRDEVGKGDTPARRAQADRLVETLEAVRHPDDLVAVGGDLNVVPDSITFDVLAGAGLTDLVGSADTRTSRYPKPLRHADYALVSDTAAIRRFDIVEQPEVSDHRPLLLEI